MASATNLTATIINEPRLSAKFFPYRPDQPFLAILKTGDNCREQSAIPPQQLWYGYGKTAEEYLSSGRIDVDKMIELLNASSFSIQSGNRILELGCAAGRMIRWLDEFAGRCEVWGVDIAAETIIWCQENLSPPFNFATVTTVPHLPFEDRNFDLVYCGSVFTHIDDLADAWLLELKRILRPGGRLYITVADKNSLQSLINQHSDHPFGRMVRSWDEQHAITTLDFKMLSMGGRGSASHVFYDIDYLKRHWGRVLNIRSVTPDTYAWQTAIVLEK